MAEIETVHNTDRSRYEAWIDGVRAGFAEYQLTDELIVFTHTEVDKKFEGQGVGSKLARFALDDVRARLSVLEAAGAVVSVELPSQPPRQQYRLTASAD